MTPFPTKQEVAAMKAEAKELWAQSNVTDDLFECLRLRREAHPYHPCTSSGVAFRIGASHCSQYIYLHDTYGMLTVVDRQDSDKIIDWLFNEVKHTGFIREILTGKNPLRDLERTQEERMAKMTTKEKAIDAITLDDLLD